MTDTTLPPLRSAPATARVKSWSARLAALSGWRLFKMPQPLDLVPRWGYGRPAHEGLVRLFERGTRSYARTLDAINDLGDRFAAIPVDAGSRSGPLEPCWTSSWLTPKDAAILYAMVVAHRPSRYVEIGSGLSTLFARRATRDHAIECRLTSIDPEPRAEIDQACDVVVRKRLEESDLSIFTELEAGDIVFLDGSHQVTMNSDVTVFFLEVLPVLAPGVVVQIHDIWLPYDYPAEWRTWLYAEQYMLAAALLAAPERYPILMPALYTSVHPDLADRLDALWKRLGLSALPKHGASFWLETAPPAGVRAG